MENVKDYKRICHVGVLRKVLKRLLTFKLDALSVGDFQPYLVLGKQFCDFLHIKIEGSGNLLDSYGRRFRC